MNVAFRDLKVGAQVQLHRAKSLAEGKSPNGASVKFVRADKKGATTEYVFEAVKSFRFGSAEVSAGQECVFKSPGLADQCVAVLVESKVDLDKERRTGRGGLSLTERNAQLVERMIGKDPASAAKSTASLGKLDGTEASMSQILQETMVDRSLPEPTVSEAETDAMVQRLRLGMIAEAQKSLGTR